MKSVKHEILYKIEGKIWDRELEFVSENVRRQVWDNINDLIMDQAGGMTGHLENWQLRQQQIDQINEIC